MEHSVIPLNLQEAQNLPHPLLRVKNQLLVEDRQTPWGPQLLALGVHGLHGTVPPLETLLVWGQVEASDGDLGKEGRMSLWNRFSHYTAFTPSDNPAINNDDITYTRRSHTQWWWPEERKRKGYCYGKDLAIIFPLQLLITIH